MFTNEFPDLRRDFGPFEAHLNRRLRVSEWSQCIFEVTYHKQLPEGPDVTLSASAASRQSYM
jgi:hypothetical protein